MFLKSKQPKIPMIIMYKSIGADSKLLFRDLILIPKPAVAPVDSAAISVVSAARHLCLK